eukprot:COSAG01_NODE_8605_length_2721_cov_15.757056_2_plen_132_part_00
MRFHDFVALALVSWVVGLHITAEVKDIKLCQIMSRDSKKLRHKEYEREEEDAETPGRTDSGHQVTLAHQDSVQGRMTQTAAGEVSEGWSDAIWFLNAYRHFGLLPGGGALLLFVPSALRVGVAGVRNALAV